MLSDRDRRDIQGLVLFGTTCPLLRYHFFRASEPVSGRRFIRTLIAPGSFLRVNSAGHREAEACMRQSFTTPVACAIRERRCAK